MAYKKSIFLFFLGGLILLMLGLYFINKNIVSELRWLRSSGIDLNQFDVMGRLDTHKINDEIFFKTLLLSLSREEGKKFVSSVCFDENLECINSLLVSANILVEKYIPENDSLIKKVYDDAALILKNNNKLCGLGYEVSYSKYVLTKYYRNKEKYSIDILNLYDNFRENGGSRFNGFSKVCMERFNEHYEYYTALLFNIAQIQEINGHYIASSYIMILSAVKEFRYQLKRSI